MNLVIHRGSREVGGSCIEIFHDDTRILLDVGLPLESDLDDDRTYSLGRSNGR